MRRLLKTILVIMVFLSLSLSAHTAVVCLKKFDFDKDEALDNWKTIVLNGKVDYVLMREGEEGFIQALSRKSCSALYYRLSFDLEEYPHLCWRWRVLKFPDKSNAKTEEEKDDYAARVYVIFPHLSFSSSRFIEYIWSLDIPVGTVLSSPSGDNVKMIVVRSGPLQKDGWAIETRDVYQDYMRVFGKEPRRKPGAIAIMCDSDSTESVAESLFDNIVIGKRLVY